MITYIVDGVLLLALALTSLRVGAMHRELRRLKGCKAEYLQVFDDTSRAVDNIDAAVRHIGHEGVEMLQRLEAAIGKAGALSKRLEDMARAAETSKRDAGSDDIGTYSRKVANAAVATSGDAPSRSEILRFAGDSRMLPERGHDAEGDAGFTPLLKPARTFRMAPSVKTLRAAGGNG
jgi:hypothetical protein